MNCWQILDIAPTDNQRDIKRAYAKKLKQTHPEDDPEGFQILQEAFETAQYLVREQLVEIFEEDERAAPDVIASDQDLETGSSESASSDLNTDAESNSAPAPDTAPKTDTAPEPDPGHNTDFAAPHSSDSNSVIPNESYRETTESAKRSVDSDSELNLTEQKLTEQNQTEQNQTALPQTESPPEEGSAIVTPSYIQQDTQALAQDFLDQLSEILDDPKKRKKDDLWMTLLQHEVLQSIDGKQEVSFAVFELIAVFIDSHKAEQDGAYISKAVLEALADLFDWQSDELTLARHYDPELLEKVLVAIYGRQLASYSYPEANNASPKESRWKFFISRFGTFLFWFFVLSAMMRGFTYLLDARHSKQAPPPQTIEEIEITKTVPATRETTMEELLNELNDDEIAKIEFEPSETEDGTDKQPETGTETFQLDANVNAAELLAELHSGKYEKLTVTGQRMTKIAFNGVNYLIPKGDEDARQTIETCFELKENVSRTALADCEALAGNNNHSAQLFMTKFYLTDERYQNSRLAEFWLNKLDADNREYQLHIQLHKLKKARFDADRQAAFKQLEMMSADAENIRYMLAYLYLRYPDHQPRIFSPIEFLTASPDTAIKYVGEFDYFHTFYYNDKESEEIEFVRQQMLAYAQADYPFNMSNIILYAATLEDNKLFENSFMLQEGLNIVNDAKYSGDPDYHDSLAAVYAAMGEFETAIMVQERAISLLDPSLSYYEDDLATFNETLWHYQAGSIHVQPRYSKDPTVFYDYMIDDFSTDLAGLLEDPKIKVLN